MLCDVGRVGCKFVGLVEYCGYCFVDIGVVVIEGGFGSGKVVELCV